MAWKPWYERAAEMNGKEAEEFMKGVFGFRPRDKRPIVAGLVAGVVGGKIVAKALKKK